MKKLISALMFSLLSLPAFAASQDEQVDLELEAAALATYNQSIPEAPAAPTSFFGLELKNPFDFLKGVKEQIDGVKDTLVTTYDENGNGKIDVGTEFDNFREGVKTLLTFAADKNANGKIDFEDIAALTKEAVANLRSQTLTSLCPAIHKQADFAGIFLKFNPVLTHFENVCLEHDAEGK